MNKLVEMLRTSAQADKAKALLSLELLGFIRMLKKHLLC